MSVKSWREGNLKSSGSYQARPTAMAEGSPKAHSNLMGRSPTRKCICQEVIEGKRSRPANQLSNTGISLSRRLISASKLRIDRISQLWLLLVVGSHYSDHIYRRCFRRVPNARGPIHHMSYKESGYIIASHLTFVYIRHNDVGCEQAIR